MREHTADNPLTSLLTDGTMWVPNKENRLMDTTELTYTRKSVYGKDNLYLVGPGKAAVMMLTGRLTISDTDLVALEMLGFTLREVCATHA